jgi:hypothetical protein
MFKRDSCTISIQQIRRANEEIANGHWFTPEAKRFFDSRWSDTATLTGLKAYFVSSEQFRNGAYSESRKYSVRVCDMATGRIDTVGEFQAYGTPAQAQAAIRKIVKEAS